MKIYKVREFNENDWYMCLGAECFEDGSLPVILDTMDITIVADKTGIEVIDENLEIIEQVQYQNVNQENAIKKIKMLASCYGMEVE